MNTKLASKPIVIYSGLYVNLVNICHGFAYDQLGLFLDVFEYCVLFDDGCRVWYFQV